VKESAPFLNKGPLARIEESYFDPHDQYFDPEGKILL
jgi:hypothetical protein